MDAATLTDRLHRAAGRTAALVGTPHDLLRPAAPHEPLAAAPRILRLPIAFFPLGGGINRPVGYGEALWEAQLDAAYTRPGDLLRCTATGAVHFIAAQQPLLPVLCVRAARQVDITRSAAAASAGLNAYGGTVTATDSTLATAWPASILATGGQGTGQSGIAADLPSGAWQVLLPSSLAISLRTGDRLTDDLGRVGVIAATERSELGWRLWVRQAST